MLGFGWGGGRWIGVEARLVMAITGLPPESIIDNPHACGSAGGDGPNFPCSTPSWERWLSLNHRRRPVSGFVSTATGHSRCTRWSAFQVWRDSGALHYAMGRTTKGKSDSIQAIQGGIRQ